MPARRSFTTVLRTKTGDEIWDGPPPLPGERVSWKIHGPGCAEERQFQGKVVRRYWEQDTLYPKEPGWIGRCTCFCIIKTDDVNYPKGWTKILNFLDHPMSPTEVAAAIDMSLPSASRKLAAMHEAKLVKVKPAMDGRSKLYSRKR
jgi:hypothetical protein